MKFNGNVIEGMKKLIKISSDRLIIKASEDEANYLGGENDIIKSTVNLSDLGGALIISTLGKNGSIIKKRDEKIKITGDLRKDNMIPVFLTQQLIEHFYEHQQSLHRFGLFVNL